MQVTSNVRQSLSRRRLLASLVLTPALHMAVQAASIASSRAAAAADTTALTEGARSLVEAFTGEGVLLLEDQGATAAERAQRFRGLLDRYFATDTIARWVLGRYWNQFGPQEQAEYRRLFEDLVIYGYVKRFGEYTGERLRITRTLADSPTQATVFSEIDRSSGSKPVRVDWRVGMREGVFKITDVVVENVSLSQTWRSDFASVIQQGGGPAALLRTLRERTVQLRADLGIPG
jgi:phospholipid transport system substrate-binding protein